MTETRDGEAVSGQNTRLAQTERRLQLTVALERDSRTLVQVAHAKLFQEHAARQAAEAQVARLEAVVAELRGELEGELERRDARIRELKGQLDRIRNSIAGRAWHAVRGLTSSSSER